MEWETYDHENKEKSSDWFWSVGIIVISVAIVLVIFGNIIGAILVVVATFVLALFAKHEPHVVHVVVNEVGISKDRTMYTFSSLDSFWVDDAHPFKKILLKSKKPLMPLIVIPLGDDVDVDRLHRTLSRILDEEYHVLPFIERLLGLCRFLT